MPPTSASPKKETMLDKGDRVGSNQFGSDVELYVSLGAGRSISRPSWPSTTESLLYFTLFPKRNLVCLILPWLTLLYIRFPIEQRLCVHDWRITTIYSRSTQTFQNPLSTKPDQRTNTGLPTSRWALGPYQPFLRCGYTGRYARKSPLSLPLLVQCGIILMEITDKTQLHRIGPLPVLFLLRLKSFLPLSHPQYELISFDNHEIKCHSRIKVPRLDNHRDP